MATEELHQLSVVYWCDNGCNIKFMCIDSEFWTLSRLCVSTQFLIDKTKTDVINAILIKRYGFNGEADIWWSHVGT